MRRMVLFALIGSGCGLDVIGVATSSPEIGAPSPESDAMTAMTETGGPIVEGGTGVEDASVEDAPAAKPDAAVPDAGAPDPCAACRTTPKRACVASTCKAARRVFVTRAGYGAKFGSIGAADQACATAATTAQLGGHWYAWISDSNADPQHRFEKSPDPYYMLDGTEIAANFAGLMPMSVAVHVDHPIDHDENGMLVAAPADLEVWTGTDQYGYSSGAMTCQSWTSNSGGQKATVGLLNQGGYTFTSTAATESCDHTTAHLYCFEQP